MIRATSMTSFALHRTSPRIFFVSDERLICKAS